MKQSCCKSTRSNVCTLFSVSKFFWVGIVTQNSITIISVSFPLQLYYPVAFLSGHFRDPSFFIHIHKEFLPHFENYWMNAFAHDRQKLWIVYGLQYPSFLFQFHCCDPRLVKKTFCARSSVELFSRCLLPYVLPYFKIKHIWTNIISRVLVPFSFPRLVLVPMLPSLSANDFIRPMKVEF